MSGQHYLDLLKENGLNHLKHYTEKYAPRDSMTYAVILSKKDIRVSRDPHKDHLLTCYISDPSLESGTCCLNIFSKSLKNLEAFTENRIVQLKNFHTQKFNNSPQITLNSYSQYAIFTAKKTKRIQLAHMDFSVGPQELVMIKALDAWNAEPKDSEAIMRVPLKRPFLETSEIHADTSKYFDYVGLIVEKKEFDMFTSLVLTDYTENPFPPNTDENPYQKYQINCSVWDENRDDCANLEPNQFVLLRNCAKKQGHGLEFNIHGNRNQNRNKIMPLAPDDDLVKKIVARREAFKANAKKRPRNEFETYPLRTEFISKKRGGSKSFQDIKSQKDGVCEVKASISGYSPEDIKDWIQGYCFKCHVRTPVDTFCPKCDNPTSISYDVKLTLKNEEKEVLQVYCKDRLLRQVPAHQAHQSEVQFEKLKRMVQLAADPFKNVFFDFCIGTVDGQSCIMNTQFILEEEE